jgi:hypothetical protein
MHLGIQNIDNYFLPDFYIYSLLEYTQMTFSEDVKALLLTPKSLMW